MKGLKVLGVEELGRLQNRIGRQFGLQRISEADYINLRDMTAEIKSYIAEMEEVDVPDAEA